LAILSSDRRADETVRLKAVGADITAPPYHGNPRHLSFSCPLKE
jgi:hypothetical protein